MYRLILLLFITVLTGSCQNPAEQHPVSPADTSSIIIDTVSKRLSIVDSLMLDYREQYNKYRGTPGADTSVGWMFSNMEVTDTATYLVYQVIHDVSNSGDDANSYVTDAWVYIDTVKRRLYEYDVATERLK